MTNSSRGSILAAASLSLAVALTFVSSDVVFADHLAFVEVQTNDVAGVTGLVSPYAGAVSPDGTTLYVAAANSGSVVAFAVEAATGHLAFLDSYPMPAVVALRVSVSSDGSDVYATAGQPISDQPGFVRHFKRDTLSGTLSSFSDVELQELSIANGIIASPDDRFVYACGESADRVVTFDREVSTGQLAVTDLGAGIALDGPQAMAVSPDGATLYVTAIFDNAVHVLSRDAVTGLLTPVEVEAGIFHPTGVAVSPDGLNVYVTSEEADMLVVFARDQSNGTLTNIQVLRDGIDGLDGAEAPAVSPDGRYVYVASRHDSALVAFSRDAATGLLAPSQLFRDGVNGVDGLHTANFAVVAPDGSKVFVMGLDDDAVAVFRRVATGCGNGSLDPGETCDDGNEIDGDCCTASCTLDPEGSACSGGACDGTGICHEGSTTTISSTTTMVSTTSTTTSTTIPCDDADGDAICAASDNCPSVANPEQTNLDGDGLGDPCDPVDASLNVVQVRLRRDSSSKSDNGSVTAKGDFLTTSTIDAVHGAQGSALLVKDALGMVVQQAWAASECVTSGSGTLSCGALITKAKLKLRPIRSTPGQFRFATRLRRLAIQTPLAGPVTITISYGEGIDRVGSIGFCGSTDAGLKCPP
jgi:cysteine-rich repeat protein